MITRDRLHTLIAAFKPRRFSLPGHMDRYYLAVVANKQNVFETLANIIVDCEDACEAAALVRGAKTYDGVWETIIYWPASEVPT